MCGQDGFGCVGTVTGLCHFGQGLLQGKVARNAVIGLTTGHHQGGDGIDAVATKRLGIDLHPAALVFIAGVGNAGSSGGAFPPAAAG